MASFEAQIRNLQNTVSPHDVIEELFLKSDIPESRFISSLTVTTGLHLSTVVQSVDYRELAEIQKKDLENLQQEIQDMLNQKSLTEI